MKKYDINEILQLFFVFFKVGGVTFGGGLAMLPILERELVEKRKWITLDDLHNYYVIGQSTPGIIAVNVATFVGFKRQGALGAFIATCGMVAPSLIIIVLIASFLTKFSQLTWVRKMLSGINIAVAALVTQALVKFAKRNIKNVIGVIIFIASFILMSLYHVHSIVIILSSSLLGILLYTIGNKNK